METLYHAPETFTPPSPPQMNARILPAGALAQRCFEQCRAHEPTLVSVWEAQGHAAALNMQVGGALTD